MLTSARPSPRQAYFLLKRALFPGLDLHTRCRYRYLPRFFRPGPIDTLDAGCGNGALSYAAYRAGNRVLGISYDEEAIGRAQSYFARAGMDMERLQFEVWNLYDLPLLGRTFDQIICSETIEHIRRDDLVVEHFHATLRPGGVLHLCAPFALHPEHRLGRIEGPEDGGHVRDGYTLESYRALLEPRGFTVTRAVGLGSPLLVRVDSWLSGLRARVGDAVALPLFLLLLPLMHFDSLDPPIPYSLYVEAMKAPGGAHAAIGA